MPRADYVPYTTVKPEGPRQVTERVDIRFPEVAFHNSVGQALAQVGEQGFGTLSRATKEVANGFDNLGANFAHTGTELWNRAIGLQDVQNQTTQAKAEIEFDKYVGEKQIAFKQLEGDAANETTFKAHLRISKTSVRRCSGSFLIKLSNMALIKALAGQLLGQGWLQQNMLQRRLGSHL